MLPALDLIRRHPTYASAFSFLRVGLASPLAAVFLALASLAAVISGLRELRSLKYASTSSNSFFEFQPQERPARVKPEARSATRTEASCSPVDSTRSFTPYLNSEAFSAAGAAFFSSLAIEFSFSVAIEPLHH